MNIKNRIPPIINIFYGAIIFETASLLSLFFSWSNFMSMVGSLTIITVFIFAPKTKVPHRIRGILYCLFLVIIFMVLRGSIIGRTPLINGVGSLKSCSLYEVIRYFLVVNHSALALLLPFIIMIDWNPKELRYFGPMALVSSLISLLAIYIYRDSIFQAMTQGLDYYTSDNLAIRTITRLIFIGGGLILCCSWCLNYFRHKKEYLIIPATLIAFFICNVLGGGRGGSMTALAYLLIFLYFTYVNTKKTNMINKFRTVFIFFLFLFGLYYMYYHTEFFSVLISRTFEGGEIGGELRDSSRDDYMNAMIQDFNEHPLCWFLGRGVNGSYLISSGIYRNTLEWGYMWLILKGGVIYLILYVLVLLKSFYSGFYCSNNNLSKALGLLCLVQILLLIPFGIPDVSTQFLLVWHAVRLLNTREFLSLRDDDVQRLLNVT